MKKLGILIALPGEARTLCRQPPAPGACLSLDANRRLVVSGAGAAAAHQAAERLLRDGIDILVSWGCAGGLDPSFEAGSLLLPKSIIAVDGRSLTIASPWRQSVCDRLESKMPVCTETLAEAASVAGTAAAKADIRSVTGAVAVDMESAEILRVAEAAGVECAVIRTIADPAAMDLPGAVSAGLDSNGRMHLHRLLIHALLHPSDFIGLVKLGGHFRRASNTLRGVAAELDAVGWCLQ